MNEQKFPDANDRTPNDPCVLLSSASVRRLYEAERGSEKLGFPKATEKDVQLFIIQKAKESQWDDIEFLGNQVLLKQNLPLRVPKIS